MFPEGAPTMRYQQLFGIVALTIGLAGCGSHTNPSLAKAGNGNSRLTSATITFVTLQDGKDAKSAVSAQLLRSGNELAADASASGTAFKENTSSPPIALAIKGPFTRSDVQTGELRLRLTPDGNDTWTFSAHLALRYADETEQNFAWQGVRLDEKAPERTLVLAGAQQP
jgi:hypothetical protein